jgi:hypothetical protein
VGAAIGFEQIEPVRDLEPPRAVPTASVSP